MEPSFSSSVSPTEYMTYPGATVEVACIGTAHGGLSRSLNVSWMNRSLSGNVTLPGTHLRGHVLVLEGVSETDSGQYCCRLGESRQDEACTHLNVLSQGKNSILDHKHIAPSHSLIS